MIKAEVNQSQLNALLAKLRRTAAAVKDPTTPNRQVSAEFMNFVLKNFQTEGGMSEDGTWVPLADSTVDWKERHGYRMILQNEGELRDSFLPMYSRTYAGVGAQKLGPVSKTALKDARESELNYDQAKRKGKLKPGREPMKITLRPPDIAAVHEYGSADGRIPARPMLPSYAQALAMGMRVYDLWIKEHTR